MSGSGERPSSTDETLDVGQDEDAESPEAVPPRKRSTDDLPEQFALRFDRRVAVGALWLGGIALAVAALTVLLYATRDVWLGSPWAELRAVSGWLLLVYLPSSLCSVVLGIFVVWISRDFKRTGALAAVFGAVSLLMVLLGYAAWG